MNTSGIIWSEAEEIRRAAFHARAKAGARDALAAFAKPAPRKTIRVERKARRSDAPRDVIDLRDVTAVLPSLVPLWKQIALEVCEKHGVSFREVLSPRRKVKLVAARHEIMFRLHTETTMSLPAIGRKLDRDHTSILYAVRSYAERNGIELA